MAHLDDVRALANELIRTHLDATIWSFEFDRAKMRAGLCDFRTHRISLSRFLAERYSDDEVRQVLLHEIAHALAGPRAGHSSTWKKIARAIGYDGSRTHAGSAAADLAPLIGLCPAGHEFYRFRRSSRPLSCGRCARGFSRDNIITWYPRELS